MTNLGWIRCRTCSSSFSMISSGATSSGSNSGIIIASMSNLNGGDHLMRRSHFRYYYRYYRPWINCNQYTGTYHYNKQQQIAQFCKKAKKIMNLIEEVKRSPFSGTGKPEPLRYNLAKAWSRRIDQEHRLVYTVDDNKIRIISCRYHY